MSLRCGCPAEGDEIVFGQCRTCQRGARPTACICTYRRGLYRRWVLDPDCRLHTAPPEPPYMETLDEDERTGH